MGGRVAVVLPFYRSERWIHMMMRSLISQEYDNFHIFAVSDGAEGNLLPIMKEWESRHPEKITVLCQENKGTGGALNTGFDAAFEKGGFDYGTMVSGDNIYYPNFLSCLVKALDHSPKKVAMVYADFQYIDVNNRVIETVIHDFKPTSDLVNGYDQGPAFMFRMDAKRAAGDYWRRICEDYDMAVRLARYGDFELVRLVLMGFRYNPGKQLTGSNKEEEERAAEHSRRLARLTLSGEQDITLDDIYPDDVDPYIHRYDHEAAEKKGLDDV